MTLSRLEIFARINGTMPILDWMELFPYDDLLEIDIAHDRIRVLCHVDGKYSTPDPSMPFSAAVRYVEDNLVHPDDRQVYAALMEGETLERRLAEAEVPGVLTANYRRLMENGGWRWVEHIVIGCTCNDLPAGIARSYLTDIQTLKDRELGVRSSETALQDNLRDKTTGLLREQAFFDRAEQFLAEKDRRGWCFVAIDIEFFRLFNEWYGREAGDLVITSIGARFVQLEQEEGCLAGYLGQDDFCLIIHYNEAKLDAIYAEICGMLAGHSTSVSFSPLFGVCMIDGKSAVLDYLDRAVLAATNAKVDFRQHVRVFDGSMYNEAEHDFIILSDFQGALERGEFYYQVQPQCLISNGKIVGVEALARWRKADGEVVYPNDFIPVLEKYGFITDLDRYIWEDACAHLRAWLTLGHRAVPISLNVSQIDFYTIDVADYFEKLIEKYDLPASLIKVEITESAYVNDTSVVKSAAQRLREKGFMVLMDDFGSGYSSLNMLSTVNVDVVKLDSLFLRPEHEEDTKSIRILESIVGMAKTMNLPIICEGVETEEQARFLGRLGCRYVQGYYFHRPMDNAQFEVLIADGEMVDDCGFVVKHNEEFRIREFLDENVYSDSMLNGILGSVAIYARHGDNVDIVRFNEQFYQIVNVPDFEERQKSIQRFVPADDLPTFYKALDDAKNNRLNGSMTVVGFAKPDGSTSRFMMRFYCLGGIDDGNLYYGSVRDVTELLELQREFKLLAKIADMSVILLRKRGKGTYCQVVLHGLEKEMGITQEELQEEIDDGRFFNRLDAATARDLHSFMKGPEENADKSILPFWISGPHRTRVCLTVTVVPVEEPMDDVVSMMTFRVVATLD